MLQINNLGHEVQLGILTETVLKESSGNLSPLCIFETLNNYKYYNILRPENLQIYSVGYVITQGWQLPKV